MERLGPYKISGELGRGGMGVVYRGRDERIGRDVAIKTIKLSHEDAQEKDIFRQRLMRDAQLAGILSHPGIVTVYELADEGDITYIVMELVHGPTLHEMLARPGGVQLEVALEILRQTAGALDYAHKKGVVHRDIKPANIMLDDGETVKIVDFGTAKLFTAAHTQTGFLLGTPYYMSPEQVYSKPLDGRSDQFALAVIAFEILLGHRPFQGESLPSLVHKIVSEAPQINPGDDRIAPEAMAVLYKALSKNPGDRFPTCCSFVKELHAKLLPSQAGGSTQPFAGAAPPSSGPLAISIGGKTFQFGPTGMFSRIGRKKAVFATSGLAIVLSLASAIPHFLHREHPEPAAAPAVAPVKPPPPVEKSVTEPPPATTVPELPVPQASVPPKPVPVKPKQPERKETAKKETTKTVQVAKAIPPTLPESKPPAPKQIYPLPQAPQAPPAGTGCLADYTGVPSGTLTWTGKAEESGSIHISGSNASSGRLISGKLPRVPVQISGVPAGATVVQHPTEANKCAPLVIRITDPQVTSLRIGWQAQ